MPRKVLIVEDDGNIAELLHLYLEKEGFETKVAKDGGKGVEYFRSFQPALVLLDIMLPIMDGWTVLKKIREESAVPVIMLTAKGETEDKVTGLESGADDYIVKPFEILELLARVEAVLRRVHAGAEVFDLGDCHVEFGTHRVFVAGREVALTPQEFMLLGVLVRNRNLALSREKLLQLAWGYDYEGDTRTVDVHIQKLRKKLGFEDRIQTVYKLGYRLSTKE